jgi:hypothetical protein
MSTAEEIQNKYLDKYGNGDLTAMMIEFAEIHVKKALETASKNAEISFFKLSQYSQKPRWKKVKEDEELDIFSHKMKMFVDKNSILKSYNKNKIK